MPANPYFTETTNNLKILDFLHHMNTQAEKIDRIIAPFLSPKSHYLPSSDYEDLDETYSSKFSDLEIRNGITPFDISHLLVNADVEEASLSDEEKKQILNTNDVSTLEENYPEDKIAWEGSDRFTDLANDTIWEDPDEISADINKTCCKNQTITDFVGYDFSSRRPYEKLCIGIGQYKAKSGEKLYMTVILDLYDRRIASFSFGSFLKPEITEKAIALFMETYAVNHDMYRMFDEPNAENCLKDFIDDSKCDEKCYPMIHSSQKAIYKTWKYREICNYHGIRQSMTQPGTRGGIAPISTFFSGLKRKLNGYVFNDIQDAIDWLENYILLYNLQKVYGNN